MQPTTASRKARSWETTTHRPGEAAQPVLQPAQPVAVEVVGRLVEQQDRRPGQQRPGQQGARLLAAREPGQRRGRVEVVDAQRAARLLQRGLQRPAAQRLEARLRLAVALQRGGRRVARGQSRLQSARSSSRTVHTSPEPGAQQLAERRAGVGRLLRQPADALAAGRSTPHRGRGDRRPPAAAAGSTCRRRWGRRARRARRRRARTRGRRRAARRRMPWSDRMPATWSPPASCVRPKDSGRAKRAGHTCRRPGTPAAHPRHRTPEPARSCLAGRRSCAVAAYFTAEERSARRARREVRLPLRRSPTRGSRPRPPWP